jgi:hypothetical protein
MIPLDEFYSLSHRKQKELVESGHVVTDGQLADEIPPQTKTDIYVFETPITDQVVEMLKQGQYKTREIEPEVLLNRESLDDLLSELRYNRLETMWEYKGVVRAAGKDGAANIYTVDPLPFEVRTLDPTLSGHLLLSSDITPDETVSTDSTSSNSGFSEYAERVEEYWGLPESELRSKVDSETTFVDSTLGPLPMASDFPSADDVQSRILDVEPAYVHKQYNPGKVHYGICLRKSRVRRNPSLPAFQEFASYLADVYQYARLESDAKLRGLAEDGVGLYFRCLYGNYSPGKANGWVPFEVEGIENSLSEPDRRVLDVVELQPTKNSELAERWGFDDSSRVYSYLQNELNRYTTRNNDNFLCATDTARRRVINLINRDDIKVTKKPPVVPTPAKTPIEKPDSRNPSKKSTASSPNTTTGSHSSSNAASNNGSKAPQLRWTNCSSESDISETKRQSKESGIESTGQSDTEPSRLELLSELVKVNNELERVPSESDILQRSAHGVKDYENEFGSLEQALEEAGISK